MLDAIAAINEVPLAGLMLLVAAGYLLGRVRLRDFVLGPAAGTLVLALLLGHFGLTFRGLYGGTDPRITVGLFGFALFIYSVGYEAGPRFFSSLRTGRGLHFVVVGILLNFVAVAAAVFSGRALKLDAASTAGMLSGALTSAPAFAAASEVLEDTRLLSVSFALTYPFGLVGLLLMIHFIPRLTGRSLSSGLEFEDESSMKRSGGTARPSGGRTPELTRTFRVGRDEMTGIPLHELDLINRTGCVISRIRRSDAIIIPRAESTLELDDQLLATGRFDELEKFRDAIGEEIYEAQLTDHLPPARRVRVTAKEVVGKTLTEINLPRRHRCIITRVEKGRDLVEPMHDLVLNRGDIVDITGERDHVRAAAKTLGYFEPSSSETNIAVYAGGVFLGLLLGAVQIPLFGLDLALGNAGGLLLVGLILGRFPRIGPFNANVPRAARQLVRDLGILLFVAENGVKAGSYLMEGVSEVFLRVLLGGAVVTIAPVVLSILVARYLFKMREVDAWGSLCGGMTSSAALGAVKRAADSSEPAISYAATYAVASVLVTLAGQVVVLSMQ